MNFKQKVVRVILSMVGDEAFIKYVLQGRDFEEGGMRVSKFEAPEGYTYLQTIENGVNLEILYKTGSQPKKVIYMLHGGAYTQSLKDIHTKMMLSYANCCDCIVYALDYRVAPKDPYPAALEDAVAGYNFLISEGWRAEDVIVAGDSAGGGLALALGLSLKSMGVSIPETFVLSSPWVDLVPRDFTKEQRKQDMFFGGNNVIDKCAMHYAAGNDLRDPYISPIYGDFIGFKNVYISYSKGELLSYSIKDLASKLEQAKVNVVYEELDNGIHDIIATGAKSDSAKYAWSRIKNYLNSLNIK